jgi:DNA-directed RNA polymerase specialized sigma24 family protein
MNGPNGPAIKLGHWGTASRRDHDEITVRRNLWDAEAAAFFETHNQRLASYLVNLGVDLEIAADIVQDSFMVVRLRWPSIPHDRSRVTYLYKVATDRMRRSHHRSTAHRRAHLGDHVGESVAAHSHLHVPSERDAPLGMVPRRQREVLLLSRFYGFTSSEIADILTISEEHATSYLSLGERTFAEGFAAEFGLATEEFP